MPRFTVHVPKIETSQQNTLERAVFVREGWRWGAFLFGPLWLLWHRHFALGLIVLVLEGILLGQINALPLQAGAGLLAHVLISFLFGLEGVSLRRFALEKSGYTEVALVAGEDLEEAEQRFFAGLQTPPRSAIPAVQSSASAPPGTGSGLSGAGVIGLFPNARLK